MRLDHYLRASRLVVRRTLAQELCDAGAVYVNGRASKSSRAVGVGDEIELRYRRRLTKVRVARTLSAAGGGRQTSKDEASGFYEMISDTTVSE